MAPRLPSGVAVSIYLHRSTVPSSLHVCLYAALFQISLSFCSPSSRTSKLKWRFTCYCEGDVPKTRLPGWVCECWMTSFSFVYDVKTFKAKSAVGGGEDSNLKQHYWRCFVKESIEVKHVRLSPSAIQRQENIPYVCLKSLERLNQAPVKFLPWGLT